MPIHFPVEIWRLVCDALACDEELHALRNIACASHVLAEIALEKLYRIDFSLSAQDMSLDGHQQIAMRWRSVILSSKGVTMFPYCLWIRDLELGHFKELLTDIAHKPDLRREFFEGEMRDYEIYFTAPPEKRRLTDRLCPTRRVPRLDIQNIILQVGEDITLYAKHNADANDRLVAIRRLEAQRVPIEPLTIWVSRLATLESLHILDGSVLDKAVAMGIKDNCPRFRELTCFYCFGTTVDKSLATFFSNLKPNSLETFSVSSKSDIGSMALEALALHSASLTKLVLLDLPQSAMASMGSLSACRNMQHVEFQTRPSLVPNWEKELPDSFKDTAAWLSSCSDLSFLRIQDVGGGTELVQQILDSGTMHLKTLDLTLIERYEGTGLVGKSISFFQSLARHTSLETFFFRTRDIPVNRANKPEQAALVGAVCGLHKLRVLDIMYVELTYDNMKMISCNLCDLEEFLFDGEDADDEFLDLLAGMPKLTLISTNATTQFTKRGIKNFFDTRRDGCGSLPKPPVYLSLLAQDADDPGLKPSDADELLEYASTHGLGELNVFFLDLEDDMDSEYGAE